MESSYIWKDTLPDRRIKPSSKVSPFKEWAKSCSAIDKRSGGGGDGGMWQGEGDRGAVMRSKELEIRKNRRA